MGNTIFGRDRKSQRYLAEVIAKTKKRVMEQKKKIPKEMIT